jgi:endonuclease/exonuclease/phosphatase (EEP) superfamily protein YafD
VVTWALTVPVTAWAVVRGFGWEGSTILFPLLAFTPYVAALTVVPVAVAALWRQWVALVVAGLALAVLVGCVAPRTFGSPSTVDGTSLVVMSTNLRIGGADPASIVDLVRQHHVDVLTLQEFTPDAQTALERTGLPTVLPYAERHPVEGAGGSAVYSRLPLSGGGATVNAGSDFVQAHAVLRLRDGTTVTVVSVHPVAPIGADGIRLLAQQLPAEPPAPDDGSLRILAGDFNSTLDHAGLRRLIATGYHDAASAVGAGLVPTWPYYGEESTITPKVTIDHVLVSPTIGVRDLAAFTVPRTDHRAVITTLTIPTVH